MISSICNALQILVVGCFAVLMALGVSIAPAVSSPLNLTVYRDPGCSCCGGWMEHLEAVGMQTENVPTENVDQLKQQYGVPDSLTSCHTAIVDGYIIEGHVPAADIQRLIAEHPNVAGLAVPGMPIGTPGMEADSDQARDSFTVFSFDQTGHTEPFNHYSF